LVDLLVVELVVLDQALLELHGLLVVAAVLVVLVVLVVVAVLDHYQHLMLDQVLVNLLLR
tara:strand:- start:82 stop:261 length:180 start_codon:yes stop_codon:yes gene_type:complete